MTLTRVAIFAGTHWIVGMINTEGQRLNELANDRTSDFFSVVEVRVHTELDLNRPLASLTRMVIPKKGVTLVASLEERHEAPENRRTYLQRKLAFPMFVTVPGVHITGKLHLPTRLDPVALLSRLAAEGSGFFALADAQVAQLRQLGGADVAPVVLIAKQALTGCYVAESPVE